MEPVPALEVIRQALWWVALVALWCLLARNTGKAILLLLAIPELRKRWWLTADEPLRRLLSSDALPPVSLLVPACDAESTIASRVQGLLALEYPRLEIVIVNDGSRDGTMEVLKRDFGLHEEPTAVPPVITTRPIRGCYRSRRHPRLVVIDKGRGGTADALNAALNVASHPFAVAVDAEMVIAPDALVRLARPVLLGGGVAGVVGAVGISNGSTIELGRVTDTRVGRSCLTGCQVVEHLRDSLVGRLGWNRLGGNPFLGGAFGLFRTTHLRAIGGYRADDVVGDRDLIVRLRRHLHERRLAAEIPLMPDPVAWTEVPVTARVLARQRERWHRGLIGTLWEHRTMLFNPRYGRIGLFAMPFCLFGELIAPVVELFGWLGLLAGLAVGAINGSFALLFVSVAIGYGMLLSVWAIVLEDLSFRRYKRRADFVRLLWFALVEGLGYRQMTVLFRLQAFWRPGMPGSH